MEGFERLHDIDAGKLTDADGETFIANGRLLRRIAREIASDLSLEELAFILRQAADKEWAHAGDLSQLKMLASEVYTLAANLAAIAVKVETVERIRVK